jgi:hypothetical protein
MRNVVLVLALLAAAPHASGSVTTVVVTKNNQSKAEVEFTLTVEKHTDPTLDTVFVKLVVAKKGKLEQLNEVVLQVKDGDALVLRVPLSLKQEKDSWVGTFHISPAQARRCEIRLVCPSPVPTSVTSYDIQLGTYLPK